MRFKLIDILKNKNFTYFIILYCFFFALVECLASEQALKFKIDSVQRRIQKSKNSSDKSGLYFQLAKYYLEQNKSDSALLLYKNAYQLLPDTLNEEAEKILNETGLFYYQRSNFTKALTYFQKALYIAAVNNDSSTIAMRYSNIAVIYDHLGDYVKSFENNQEALKIFEKQKFTRGMAFIYNNLGVLSEEMEKPEDALIYHRKALKLKKELDNKSGVGNTLNNIGVVFEQYSPDYDSSLFYYKLALDVFNEANDQSGIATALGNIGVIYWLKHQADSSIFYNKMALKIRKSIKDEEGISSTLLNLGRAYFDKEDFQESESYFQQSLVNSEKINSRKMTSDIYEALALLYDKKKDYNKAYNYHLKYSQLRDSIINEENNKQIGELKTRYDLEKKDKQLNVLSHQNQLQQESITRYNFLLAAILLIALLIAIITVLLVRQNRLKTKQQTAELQQKLLRSQMNPHFIFNTLFSIQTYMLENDAKSASRFLSGFAKLMRHILENSKHEFVSLENEFEFLNNYLHIQQLRFTESFTYEVIIDNEEELSQLIIPPMLSQPFVENAIEHGIRNMDGPGRIKVLFNTKGKNVEVTIEDNGEGINAKTKDKKEQKNHKSTGIQNTKQRLQMLTNNYKTEYIFKIIDLGNKVSGETGTRITFSIPKIYM